MKIGGAECHSSEPSKSEDKNLPDAIKLAQDNPSNSIKDKEYTSTSLPADPKVMEMKKHILSREGVESVEFIAKGGQGTAFLISMSDGTKKFGKVIDIGDINKLINSRAEFRETLAGKGLEHKGIPRSHVTESFNDNTQYLFIRDYVTGVSLKELIQQKGKLSSEEAKGYLRQGLELLEYLHDTKKHPEVGQVIHRDVKPSNIIIDGDGKLFLVDFGCAHFRTPNEQSMTKYDMGTEGYKSGEQYIGGACASSDLYSLGVTILEGLIADRPLLVNKLKENWFSDAIGQPFEIPSDLEICPQLRRVLQKMIKANHAERYKSAGEAAAALDRPDSVGIFGYLRGPFNWRRMFNLNQNAERQEASKNNAPTESLHENLTLAKGFSALTDGRISYVDADGVRRITGGVPEFNSRGAYAAELAISKSVASILSNWETLIEQGRTHEDGLVATIEVPAHQLSFTKYSGLNYAGTVLTGLVVFGSASVVSAIFFSSFLIAPPIEIGVIQVIEIGVGVLGCVFSVAFALACFEDLMGELPNVRSGDSSDSLFNRVFRDPDPTTSNSPSLSLLTQFLDRAGAKMEWDDSEISEGKRITKVRIVLTEKPAI